MNKSIYFSTNLHHESVACLIEHHPYIPLVLFLLSSIDAIVVISTGPSLDMDLIPNSPWFFPEKVTYLVEGKDKDILPASIFCTISSSNPS